MTKTPKPSLLDLSKKGMQSVIPAAVDEGAGQGRPAAAEGSSSQFAGARLAQGIPGAIPQRVSVFTVDAKRCRLWKYHDRDPSSYTVEECADLIDDLSVNQQQMPALARALKGDPNFDFEIIYGGRRRFVCEHLNKPLKITLTEASDAECYVLMHLENGPRKDISPMERAISFARQVKDKIFGSHEQLAKAIGMERSKGQLTKMVKAAALMQIDSIAELFPDKRKVPIELAYQVVAVMDDSDAKRVVMQRVAALKRKDPKKRGSYGEMLRALRDSTKSTSSSEPLKKRILFGDGEAQVLVLTRNSRGKITVAFPTGLQKAKVEELTSAMTKVLKEVQGDEFRLETNATN